MNTHAHILDIHSRLVRLQLALGKPKAVRNAIAIADQVSLSTENAGKLVTAVARMVGRAVDQAIERSDLEFKSRGSEYSIPDITDDLVCIGMDVSLNTLISLSELDKFPGRLEDVSVESFLPGSMGTFGDRLGNKLEMLVLANTTEKGRSEARKNRSGISGFSDAAQCKSNALDALRRLDSIDMNWLADQLASPDLGLKLDKLLGELFAYA